MPVLAACHLIYVSLFVCIVCWWQIKFSLSLLYEIPSLNLWVANFPSQNFRTRINIALRESVVSVADQPCVADVRNFVNNLTAKMFGHGKGGKGWKRVKGDWEGRSRDD